jgi:molecular chaperone GrpE
VVEENKIKPESGSYELNNIGDDVEKLKQALAEERDKSGKFMVNWQRAEADFINYKKRSEQEKNDMAAYANWSLILSLLPILDDMDRAVASLPPKLTNHIWVDGILLIYRKLKAAMEKQGLTEIEAIGKPFEPNLHEAVAYLDGEEGIVMNEAQKGYMLKNRLLRPATVVVGKGKTEKSDSAAKEKPEDTNN